jgi:CDP-diacylglycerol--glycerol-3-phosphate 3-phosphatidyltransferase
MIHALAALPPIRAIPPDVLSAAGVLTAAGAVIVATAGGRWPLLAACLVVAVGVLDGLDGAVAEQRGRVRPLGAVVDAMADRLADLLLVAVLVVLGVPPFWGVTIAASVLLHEYLRARAMAAGMPGIGPVSTAERPTRVIAVAVTSAGIATFPAGTPFTDWPWATAGAVIWLGLAVVGFAQLVVGVVRELSTPSGTSGDAAGPPATRR